VKSKLIFITGGVLSALGKGQRTPRGRMATGRAAEYFQKLAKKGPYPSLFQ
jgi:CTP synthase (UTP-ammonia lyase)